MTYRIIDEALYTAIGDYLSRCPYREVAPMLAAYAVLPATSSAGKDLEDDQQAECEYRDFVTNPAAK